MRHNLFLQSGVLCYFFQNNVFQMSCILPVLFGAFYGEVVTVKQFRQLKEMISLFVR